MVEISTPSFLWNIMYTTLIRPNKQTRLFNLLVSSFTTNIFYKFIHILKTLYQQMQYIHLAAKRERYKLNHFYNFKLHFIARKYTRILVISLVWIHKLFGF